MSALGKEEREDERKREREREREREKESVCFIPREREVFLSRAGSRKVVAHNLGYKARNVDY